MNNKTFEEQIRDLKPGQSFVVEKKSERNEVSDIIRHFRNGGFLKHTVKTFCDGGVFVVAAHKKQVEG